MALWLFLTVGVGLICAAALYRIAVKRGAPAVTYAVVGFLLGPVAFAILFAEMKMRDRNGKAVVSNGQSGIHHVD